MVDLSKYTDEQLEAEMVARAARKKKEEKPRPLTEPDFSQLVTLCQRYIEELDAEGPHVDEEWIHYIEEAAMQAIYGPDVYDWINKQVR